MEVNDCIILAHREIEMGWVGRVKQAATILVLKRLEIIFGSCHSTDYILVTCEVSFEINVVSQYSF